MRPLRQQEDASFETTSSRCVIRAGGGSRKGTGTTTTDILFIYPKENSAQFSFQGACEYFGLDSEGLNTEWAKAKKGGKLVKFGGGFYCGLIDTVEGREIRVFTEYFRTMLNMNNLWTIVVLDIMIG